MATKIDWVKNPDGTKGETWNPVTGCTKVSSGCKFCYAHRLFPRVYGRHVATIVDSDNGTIEQRPREFTDIGLHDDRLEKPLRWRKPRRVFVCSMGDLFHEAVPTEFILRVFEVMEQASQHTFQILTKRPRRMVEVLGGSSGAGLSAPPLPNVWLGVSVEDQPTADERIPLLLETPAALRFVSYEPALEHVDFYGETPEGVHDWLTGDVYSGSGNLAPEDRSKIDWVIAGCESGPKARPAQPYWFKGARDQCLAEGVPFFLKQMEIDGKLVKMPELDGEIWDQMPKGAG